MHYGNGDAVKVGDLSVFVESGQATVGIVTRLVPKSGPGCNVQITPIAQSDENAPGIWFPIAGQCGWFKTASDGFPLRARTESSTPVIAPIWGKWW